MYVMLNIVAAHMLDEGNRWTWPHEVMADAILAAAKDMERYDYDPTGALYESQ